MKLKEIKAINAKDITSFSEEDIKKLVKKENGLETVSISLGTYGMNGALFQGNNSKTLYKITARNTNLFYLV